jgi:cobalt-zinc-cadmium efflux system outer membrane protein
MKNLAPFGCQLSLLLFLVPVGCARFEPRELSPARTASTLENRSLTNAALEAFLEKNLQRDWTSWPAVSWDFEMLTLTTFYYHPDLEVARAQWRVAQAGIQTAGGRPNPTVSIVPEYNFTPSGGANPWLPAVTIDWPVETAGKRGYRIARAQHLSEAARLNVASAAWQVRSNLRNSLLDFDAAENRRALLQHQLSTQEQVVKMLNQRLQAGAIGSSELTIAQIALAKTSLDLADAERLRAESRARVAGAISVPIGALEGFVLSSIQPLASDAVTELTSAEARRRALESRFDILGSLADYAASQSALQLEVAKQYPDIHLGTGYQWDQGESKWQLGVTAEVPVLNRNEGPIAEAQERRAEAAARFEALQAKVLGDVNRAMETFRATEKSLTNLHTLAEAQARQRETVQAELNAGAADRLDLLNAQVELAATELVRLEAEIKRKQALASLEDAIQRPIEFSGAVFRSARLHAN